MTARACTCGDPQCAVPYGECHCGCHEKTNLARQSCTERGWRRGEPLAYINGHYLKTHKPAKKPPNEIRQEKIDGVLCVWMKLSRGLWTLLWAVDYPKVQAMRWWATKNGYAFWTTPEGKNIHMARILMETPYGMEPDHIHGNTLDNRRSELRNVTPQQNHFNQKKPICNTSGFKGVSRGRGIPWRARIVFNGEEHHLGSFQTETDAAKAREQAEITFYGDFRRRA